MKSNFVSPFVFCSLIALVPITASAAININLKYGSKGAAVIELQEFLKSKNLLSGSITGNFFTQTSNAVSTYQRSRGITVTGSVGPLTRAAINADLLAQNLVLPQSTLNTGYATSSSDLDYKNDLNNKYKTLIDTIKKKETYYKILQMGNDTVISDLKTQIEESKAYQSVYTSDRELVAMAQLGIDIWTIQISNRNKDNEGIKDILSWLTGESGKLQLAADNLGSISKSQYDEIIKNLITYEKSLQKNITDIDNQTSSFSEKIKQSETYGNALIKFNAQKVSSDASAAVERLKAESKTISVPPIPSPISLTSSRSFICDTEKQLTGEWRTHCY